MAHGFGVIGCGYVGTAVAMRMQRAGHNVTATTRSPENVRELQRLIIARQLAKRGLDEM